MLQHFIYIFDMVGTIACAVSGVLMATRFRMDLFGATVLAAVTALGGGSLRDMLMGASPVFWIVNAAYLYAVFLTVIISVFEKIDDMRF